ncbi:MAG: flagellar biosynthesis protein FliR [Paenibacillus sp.]|jgi:flagellar biosynthetic protein FliR|nr:flagellar biosynthesis protein FliR [Paenibacillus sp.]
MQAIVPYLPNFLLIFCRITAFFVVVPVFSTRGVPSTFKIGLSLFITFLIFVASGMTKDAVPMDGLYMISIVREILVGLFLGFIAYMFFNAVQIAGSFIDIQMGLGIANVIDPMSGIQSPIMGNFKFFIAILLFLAMNGHHFLIDAIVRSYNLIPISPNPTFTNIASGAPTEYLIRAFSNMFALALQMSAPLVVSLFLTDVGLGILSKTAPQFNIFVIGVPIKIIVGFLVLILVIPGMIFLFQDLFRSLFESMEQLSRLIGGTPKSP